MEITDRSDLGIDLNAPQTQDNGKPYWSYSLIHELGEGDIVFHYDKNRQAVTAWSRAAGSTWSDEVVWGSHGTVAREQGIRPYKRPGWRLALENFTELDKSVSLEEFRAREDAIEEMASELEKKYGRPVYLPFALSKRRVLRPAQGYLVKMPRELVLTVPTLRVAADRAEEFARVSARLAESSAVGARYRSANEEAAVSERDPFSIDPTLVERGLRGHAATQNLLAEHVRALGAEPRSPSAKEPNYDLAWELNGTVWVAEIKSMTNSNEEKQLRLGLGQILRYRQLLQIGDRRVRALIAAEKRPTDGQRWVELCESLEVLLTWPEKFEELQ
jgi:hypothetical protein